jgi:hypothetical protein
VLDLVVCVGLLGIFSKSRVGVSTGQQLIWGRESHGCMESSGWVETPYRWSSTLSRKIRGSEDPIQLRVVRRTGKKGVGQDWIGREF